MKEFEGAALKKIGQLVLELGALEKQIGCLRDEASRRGSIFAQIGRLLAFQPERLLFDGQAVDAEFAGEAAIDRAALHVDSILVDLRSAIMRKKQVNQTLADMGVDLEEAEREELMRKSRALHHPAAAVAQTRKRAIGFVIKP